MYLCKRSSPMTSFPHGKLYLCESHKVYSPCSQQVFMLCASVFFKHESNKILSSELLAYLTEWECKVLLWLVSIFSSKKRLGQTEIWRTPQTTSTLCLLRVGVYMDRKPGVVLTSQYRAVFYLVLMIPSTGDADFVQSICTRNLLTLPKVLPGFMTMELLCLIGQLTCLMWNSWGINLVLSRYRWETFNNADTVS